MKPREYWPTVLWALVILTLHIVPSDKIPAPPDWGLSLDKLVHFTLFAVLCVLLLYAYFRRGQFLTLSQLMWALVVLVLYGLILELVQIVVPGRNFSWMDLFADSIGVVAGNFIFLGYVKVKKILAKS